MGEKAEQRCVLVTGGSGFVAAALVRHLLASGAYRVLVALRSPVAVAPPGAQVVYRGELDGASDVDDAVDGVDVVVHCAARVHVMRERSADPAAEFRRANVDATVNLARRAAAQGVKRFIFLSTIKVNGEQSQPGRPLRAADPPQASDPYAISKLEAERQLFDLAHATGLEVVVIRPPLVYGPGVKGNFRTLISMVRRGVPLPLAALDNRRSLLALDNLVDLISRCLDHPAAAGQVLLACDGEDLSTPQLLRRVAAALQRRARLVAVPPVLLQRLAALLGREEMLRRLCGNLQVDDSATRQLLNWQPPLDVDSALRRAVALPPAAGYRGKRLLDIVVALTALVPLTPLLAAVALAVKCTSPGPVLYWSYRVGRDNAIFKMPKFRTMRVDTPAVATHLLTDPQRYLTRVGPLLRRTSLDELPQLWSILKGDMSIVGPRPALFNQDDLIALRSAAGVQRLTPGLTGWAQINGRDELPIPVKVELDEYYLHHCSPALDLRIIARTAFNVLKRDGVAH